MTIIKSTTGRKQVQITRNANTFFAQYVQDGEQVLQSKHFATEAGAKRWATRMLAC